MPSGPKKRRAAKRKANANRLNETYLQYLEGNECIESSIKVDDGLVVGGTNALVDDHISSKGIVVGDNVISEDFLELGSKEMNEGMEFLQDFADNSSLGDQDEGKELPKEVLGLGDQKNATDLRLCVTASSDEMAKRLSKDKGFSSLDNEMEIEEDLVIRRFSKRIRDRAHASLITYPIGQESKSPTKHNNSPIATKQKKRKREKEGTKVITSALDINSILLEVSKVISRSSESEPSVSSMFISSGSQVTEDPSSTRSMLAELIQMPFSEVVMTPNLNQLNACIQGLSQLYDTTSQFEFLNCFRDLNVTAHEYKEAMVEARKYDRLASDAAELKTKLAEVHSEVLSLTDHRRILDELTAESRKEIEGLDTAISELKDQIDVLETKKKSAKAKQRGQQVRIKKIGKVIEPLGMNLSEILDQFREKKSLLQTWLGQKEEAEYTIGHIEKEWKQLQMTFNQLP